MAEKNFKNKKITIRFTNEEKEIIQDSANKTSTTLSNYCRKKILQGNEELNFDIMKINELLNNAQWLCDGVDKDIRKKEELKKTLERICETLEEMM